MKIDSMDASGFKFNGSASNVQVKEYKTSDIEVKIERQDRRLSPQMSEVEKRELSIPDKVIVEAMERANRVISGTDRRFEISVHEKTNNIMIKVINTSTNEVVREIPPEKILDLIGNLMEMAGLIVDERR